MKQIRLSPLANKNPCPPPMARNLIPVWIVLSMILAGPMRAEEPAEEHAEKTSEEAASATADTGSDAVERGRYLAYQVASCFICHGERDWNFYAGPLTEGQEGKGMHLEYLHLDRYAPNITSATLGDWSDEEILRALTEGRAKDGSAVHAFLEQNPYRHLTADDAGALVAFLRTLEPIDQAPPENAPAAAEDAPGSEGHAAEPLPPEPWAAVEPGDTVSRGAYLVNIGSCRFCHGEDYSGGKTFQLPRRDPISPVNISPAPGTATGGRTQEAFIGRFQSFASDRARRLRAPEPAPSTVMPWTNLSRMHEEDLGAIYDFLRTVEAVEK